MIEQEALKEVNKLLHKIAPKTTVSTLSDTENDATVRDRIPTGILTLDVLLGGGWPVGRIIEIFGHESSGKSLLGGLACAQALKHDCLPVYMDCECSVDSDFFRKLGVCSEEVFYTTPDTIDDVWGVIETMMEFKELHYGKEQKMLIVWDSVASTTTAVEQERGWEAKGFSATALYLSQAFRKTVGLFGKNNTTLIMLNQIRDNVGVLFGPKIKTYGGWSPKFYSSIRLGLNEESKTKEKSGGKRKHTVGVDYRVTCVKNKIVSPFRECVLPYTFTDSSINEAVSVLTMLKELQLVANAGPYYKIELPDAGEIKFKKAEMSTILQQYRNEIVAVLNDGWLGGGSADD